MGLPNAPEALPNGPGAIIPSSTILAIEDCVIAINRLLTGEAQGIDDFMNLADESLKAPGGITEPQIGKKVRAYLTKWEPL
jgi:hypothetical protein